MLRRKFKFVFETLSCRSVRDVFVFFRDELGFAAADCFPLRDNARQIDFEKSVQNARGKLLQKSHGCLVRFFCAEHRGGNLHGFFLLGKNLVNL